jgi:hypothetical protein
MSGGSNKICRLSGLFRSRKRNLIPNIKAQSSNECQNLNSKKGAMPFELWNLFIIWILSFDIFMIFTGEKVVYEAGVGKGYFPSS